MVSIGLLSVMLHFLFPLVVARYSNNSANSAENVASVCEALHRELGNIIILPSSIQYTIVSDENWSETAWKQPSCIAQPDSLPHLQKLVTTLVAKQVHFAIRSGGHSPNPFDANINTGCCYLLPNLIT